VIDGERENAERGGSDGGFRVERAHLEVHKRRRDG
jgi:hypothetical protein